MTSLAIFDIGGRTFAVSGGREVDMVSASPAFKPFVSDNDLAEWTCSFGNTITVGDNGIELYDFVFKETNSRCSFSRYEGLYCFEMFDNTDNSLLVRMVYKPGSSSVLATSCHDYPCLRFSLWFAYSLLSSFSSISFVHSSVVVYRGRAVMFLGESGTGKSTHTRLWCGNIQGSRLLNDDSPIIALEDDRVMVYGSPWSGKTPCYQPYKFPLVAVVRLSQAPHNRIQRLSTPEAFAALQPSLPPALMQDDDFADRLVEIISSTISAVPFYHLECLPDPDAARLSFHTVFE